MTRPPATNPYEPPRENPHTQRLTAAQVRSALRLAMAALVAWLGGALVAAGSLLLTLLLFGGLVYKGPWEVVLAFAGLALMGMGLALVRVAQ